MTKKIFSIAFIYGCCCFAWIVLGGTVSQRTHQQDSSMRTAVGNLWGGEQVQYAPTLNLMREVEQTETREENGESVTHTSIRTVYEASPISASELQVNLELEHRRKGLLWYPTYSSGVDGRFRISNPNDEPGTFRFQFRFPEEASVFESVRVEVDGLEVDDASIEEGALTRMFELEPGQTKDVRVAYRSQGTGSWRYRLGDAATQVRDFSLAMTTDFLDIDFPEGALSPTTKTETEGRWSLNWDYGTLVADADVAMTMPQKLNPGPWVSRVTFFAPVSLFLFFFVLFVITLLKGVRLHPMHYFFLGCSFFAFHLLLAYLVDHVSVHLALAAASLVSVGLVISYMRLVAGTRFAMVEVGLAQVVYLVLFAYTFFLEGFTGLAVTGLTIATLFVVMQATGRVDWEQLLAKPEALRGGRISAEATIGAPTT
ncbi:MAG: inner membrane CreD family protein [Woeseia sp.]